MNNEIIKIREKKMGFWRIEEMLKVAEYLPFEESTQEIIELQCLLLVKMRCSCFEFFLRHIISPKRMGFFNC